MDDGFSIAAGFFALGLVWLFIAQMLLTTVAWMRRLLG